MNFAMDISLKVEGKLELVERGDEWTDIDEDHVYKATVETVIAEELERTGHQAWSAGDIRMGDLILLIDSDTRVPLDCFLDAASEFHHSPQVAIIQHQSGVMQVVFDFWENTISKPSSRSISKRSDKKSLFHAVHLLFLTMCYGLRGYRSIRGTQCVSPLECSTGSLKL